jgi:hypothetical protein
MMSIRKVQKLLRAHFNAHGWEVADTWKSPSGPAVLFEYWTIESRWSPNATTIYIGFENWDAYECVALSTSPPVPGEKNEWLEQVPLLKGWDKHFQQMLVAIEETRKNDSLNRSGQSGDNLGNG